MKRLIFDYSTMVAWKGHPTGIPRVVENLAHRLKDVSPWPIEFVAINDELKRFHSCDLYSRSTLGPFRFERGDLLFSAGATWAFACYHEAVAALKSELGINFSQLYYDLIPVLYPYFYGPGFGPAYGNLIAESLQLSDISFTISKCSKKDIEALGTSRGLSFAPIVPIRLGDELQLTQNGDVRESIKQKQDFILSVGTLEYRKNHIVLLNAYRILKQDGVDNLPHLVIVGREGWLDNGLAYQIETDPLLIGNVSLHRDISDPELNYLYENCLFTAFPAIYEGWGLPIAESLQYGKVSLCSGASSMIEIAPSLCVFAHPLKANEWAEKIRSLAHDETNRRSLEQKIKSEFKETEWMECAREVVNSLLNATS